MSPLMPNQSPDEGLKILVVEDHEMLREMFKLAIPSRHTVDTASSIKEGWTLYVEKSPHIVFLDVGLPDGNGHDLARRIKKRNPVTYVIMATASRYIDDKKEAAMNNVDGFITKPFTEKTINDFVELYITINRQTSDKTKL